MTGKAAPMKTNFRRRPRRSNTLKDLQRLLGTASTIYENGKDRLASHAKYFVHPREGLQGIDVRLRMMNLELQDTGFSVTADDLSLIDQYRFGMLLDMIDAGETDRLRRPPVETVGGATPESPVRDHTLEKKVRGWSGKPRGKVLGREAVQMLNAFGWRLEQANDDEPSRLVKDSLGKRNDEIERQRSGDMDWLKLEAEIRRMKSDKRWPWCARQRDPNLRPLRPKFDEEMRRFMPCADPYWHPLVVQAERDWLRALDARETMAALDFEPPLPDKSALLKRIDRDRATLNSDTMRLKIEAVEQLRIDLWQKWQPTPHDGQPMGASWQVLATALEAMGEEERVRLYREWRARGNSDKKPKKRFRELSRRSAQMTFDTSQDLGISFRDTDDDEDLGDEDVFEYREPVGDDEDLDDVERLEAEEEDEDLKNEGSTHKGLAYGKPHVGLKYRNRYRKGRSRGPASFCSRLDPLTYRAIEIVPRGKIKGNAGGEKAQAAPCLAISSGRGLQAADQGDMAR
jgi:hypothetical protein